MNRMVSVPVWTTYSPLVMGAVLLLTIVAFRLWDRYQTRKKARKEAEKYNWVAVPSAPMCRCTVQPIEKDGIPLRPQGDVTHDELRRVLAWLEFPTNTWVLDKRGWHFEETLSKEQSALVAASELLAQAEQYLLRVEPPPHVGPLGIEAMRVVNSTDIVVRLTWPVEGGQAVRYKRQRGTLPDALAAVLYDWQAGLAGCQVSPDR